MYREDKMQEILDLRIERIKELEAENERLKDWMEIVREDAMSIACLAEKGTAENISRLVINRLGQALKGE